MNAADLGRLLTKPQRTLSEADKALLRPHIVGVKDPETNEDGSLKVWDPKEKATTKDIRAPRILQTENWETARADAKTTFNTIAIVGGGESLLRLDLNSLNRIPTMGVNWTRKWFEPTYLHILDKQPFRTQVVENPSQQGAQIITCRTTLEWGRNLGYAGKALSYEVKDDSCGKYPSFQLAEKGADMFQSFPNSLGYALQAAVALGFKKIILLGFDFGGFHFFGDGRSEGCFSHYGDLGIPKHYLRPMLMAQAHYYLLHGPCVVQVGPTELKDCYPVVGSMEEALGY